MLWRSPSGASAATTASASFSEGTDSPVSADSSDFREEEVSSRASAGTKSPASSRTMSPTTSFEASTMASLPSRSTRACGAERFLSASSAFSALLSCITPITALAMTMATISRGSKNSEGSPVEQATMKEITAAASRMRIITSLNCSANRWRLVFFLPSRRRFSPSRARRAAASWEDRPLFSSVLSSASSADKVLSCGVNAYTLLLLTCIHCSPGMEVLSSDKSAQLPKSYPNSGKCRFFGHFGHFVPMEMRRAWIR